MNEYNVCAVSRVCVWCVSSERSSEPRVPRRRVSERASESAPLAVYVST